MGKSLAAFHGHSQPQSRPAGEMSSNGLSHQLHQQHGDEVVPRKDVTAVTPHPSDSRGKSPRSSECGRLVLVLKQGLPEGQENRDLDTHPSPEVQIAKQEAKGAPAPGPRG